jgi:uncharacterized protein
MSTSSRRYPLVTFFVIAYALSWAVWGTALAQEHGTLDWHLPGSLAFLAVSAAALAVTASAAGRSGLRELAARLIRWRVGARWYIAAVLIPALPAGAAVALHVLAGGHHDTGALVPFTSAIPLLLTQLLTHLLTEELGWRGFALPRLRQRHGALTASVILGLVWAVWHTPLFLLADTRQTYPYLGFVVMAVSVSIMMTWIFDRTGGSILIAALFHAAMNTAWAVLNVLWEALPSSGSASASSRQPLQLSSSFRNYGPWQLT